MIDVALPDQFVLSARDGVLRDGWNSRRCGGYSLAAHPSLPVHGVLDRDGREIGYALGWLIDEAGKLVQAPIRLPLLVSEATAERLEEILYSFGGRYAFVIVAAELKRLYLDPGGTLSAVFSEKRAMAGSTVAALVLDEPEHPLWSKPLGEFPDDRPNQYWPAGTTLDPEISRLLPNHYLDLVTWRAVRHYPKPAFEAMSDEDVPGAVEKIVSVLRRVIFAVLEATPRLYMGLTAGRDSRVLLACARDWRDRIEWVTFDYGPWRKNRSERFDVHIAQRLAERHGLPHRVIPVSGAIPIDTQRQYLQRIGFAGGAGKSRDFYWACREHLDLSAGWLTGFAAPVGKTPLSWPNDKETHRMSPAEVLTRLNLPTSDRLREAMRVWRDGLPDFPLSTWLEFAYLEHRLGSWAGPHFYGAAPFSINLTPFCHREIFDLMLRLPSRYRLRKAASHDIVAATWPEILALPTKPISERLFGRKTWVGRKKKKARSVVKRMLGRG